MHKSKNDKVQKFLDDIESIDEKKFNIVQKLRNIVFINNKGTEERIIYGGIMFSLENDFGGLFVRTNHISFEFTSGFTFKDPLKLLEGDGKYRRHLKIKSLKDMKDKNVEFFVKQAT